MPLWLCMNFMVALSRNAAPCDDNGFLRPVKLLIALTGEMRLYRLGHDSFVKQLHGLLTSGHSVTIAPYVSFNHTIAEWKDVKEASALKEAMHRFGASEAQVCQHNSTPCSLQHV